MARLTTLTSNPSILCSAAPVSLPDWDCVLKYPCGHDKAQTNMLEEEWTFPDQQSIRKRSHSGWPGWGFTSIKYCALVLLGKQSLFQCDWQVNRGPELLQLKCSIWEQTLKTIKQLAISPTWQHRAMTPCWSCLDRRGRGTILYSHLSIQQYCSCWQRCTL